MLSKIIFALFVLSFAAMGAQGLGAPVHRERTLLDCPLHLTSAEPSKLCPTPMSVPESTEGYVEVTLEYFFDTSVCLSFGATPDVQNVQNWKHGYCHKKNLFSFSRNHSIPFPAKDDPINNPKGSKKVGVEEKRSHTVKMSTTSLWGAIMGGGGADNDEASMHGYRGFGALNMLAAENVTDYPSVSQGSGSLIPRWSSNATSEIAALQYYVGVGITESDFWDGAYGSHIHLIVKQVTECINPAGSKFAPVGPKCLEATAMTLDSPSKVTLVGANTGEAVWVYYTLTVPKLDENSDYSKLVVTLNLTKTDTVTRNDVTTYIRWQGLPYNDGAMQASDKSSSSSHLVYSTTLDSPPAGRYWIGLSTTKSLQYTGHLVAQVEQCSKAERYGSSCVSVKRFSASKPIDAQVVKVTPSGTKLAYVIVNNTADIVISASSQAAKAPAIYLGAGFVPTTDTYTFKADSGNAVNRITTSTGSASLPIDWFLGVSAGNQQSLEVSVWIESICALNCSEHGVCKGTSADANHGGAIFNPSGECRCNNDDYIGFACQIDNDHDFKLEYIILIAVGGAIVLVIVVGVPVYCYIHKKKSRQSAYERL